MIDVTKLKSKTLNIEKLVKFGFLKKKINIYIIMKFVMVIFYLKCKLIKIKKFD